MKWTIILLLTMITRQCFAQDIRCFITDEKKEPIISASVMLYSGDSLIADAQTNYDGECIFHLPYQGFFKLVISGTGYNTAIITQIPGRSVSADVLIKYALSKYSFETKKIIEPFSDKIGHTYFSKNGGNAPLVNNKQITEMSGQPQNRTFYIIDGCIVTVPTSIKMKCVIGYEPLFLQHPTTYTFTRDDLRRLPSNNIEDVISTVPGTYQQRRGGNVNIYGGGNSGNLYIVDGMQISR